MVKRSGWRTTIEILEEIKLYLHTNNIEMTYILGRIRGTNNEIKSLNFSTGFETNDPAEIKLTLKNVWHVDEYPTLLSALKEDRILAAKTRRSHNARLAAKKASLEIRKKYGSFSNMFKERTSDSITKISASLKAGYASGKIKAWNTGLKSTDSVEIFNKLTVPKLGIRNPMHHDNRVYSEESKAKQSATMKRKILAGEFTPNVNNARTSWKASFKGLKFRSSWEAGFYAIYDGVLQFESIRVPWSLNGKSKVYIIDFCDEKKQILFEVKPQELVKRNHNYCVEKINAAKAWAIIHGYNFEVITEVQICAGWDKILAQKDDFGVETFNKLRSLYEAYSKNKNCKANYIV